MSDGQHCEVGYLDEGTVSSGPDPPHAGETPELESEVVPPIESVTPASHPAGVVRRRTAHSVSAVESR